MSIKTGSGRFKELSFGVFRGSGIVKSGMVSNSGRGEGRLWCQREV